jgi:hypothetical protein
MSFGCQGPARKEQRRTEWYVSAKVERRRGAPYKGKNRTSVEREERESVTAFCRRRSEQPLPRACLFFQELLVSAKHSLTSTTSCEFAFYSCVRSVSIRNLCLILSNVVTTSVDARFWPFIHI